MKTIIVVGVGALGSHVVQLLRNVNASIRVIDFDRVEQKNTMSQFHAKSSTGKNKVESVKQTMQFLWGTKLGTVPHKLTVENDSQLLTGADLLIDCLDNAPARKIVQNFARRTQTPCLHGALAPDGGFGRVVWDLSFKVDEGSEGAATCEDGQHLPFIALTSAYMARSAQVFLSQGKMVGYEISPGGCFST